MGWEGDLRRGSSSKLTLPLLACLSLSFALPHVTVLYLYPQDVTLFFSPPVVSQFSLISFIAAVSYLPLSFLSFMARKLSTAQQEYSLTQLGGVAPEQDNAKEKEAADDGGPAGFLQFCENLDVLPTPPPDLIIRRDSSASSSSSPTSSAPASPRTTSSHEKQQARKSSFFSFKKDKS